MKRLLMILGATLGLTLGTTSARADWGSAYYSGYQPWYNPAGYWTNCCRTPEEKRLQKFWHDYYHALKCYYCSLEHLDWVGYYKNHGYQINAGCNYGGGGPMGCGPNGCGPSCGGNGCNLGPINYAPVFVSPTMQWAVPNGCMNGPPVGPDYPGCPSGPGCPGH